MYSLAFAAAVQEAGLREVGQREVGQQQRGALARRQRSLRPRARRELGGAAAQQEEARCEQPPQSQRASSCSDQLVSSGPGVTIAPTLGTPAAFAAVPTLATNSSWP